MMLYSSPNAVAKRVRSCTGTQEQGKTPVDRCLRLIVGRAWLRPYDLCSHIKNK